MITPNLKSNSKDVVTKVASPFRMWEATEMDAGCRRQEHKS